ncbi:hypothetical protein [Sedimentitalea sp.]|uniref:hypothetical protein n=1 Tax=Sedimentitalea sp. TaxID=2048915 RepID=UPI003297DE59
MSLTEKQIEFLEKFIGHRIGKKKSDAKVVNEYEAYLEVEAEYLEVSKRVPNGSIGKDVAMSDHKAAMDYRSAGKFKKAHAAMVLTLATMKQVEKKVMDERTTILQRAAGLSVAEGATQKENDFLATAKKGVIDALPDERPTPQQLAAGRKVLEKAAKVVARTGTLKELHERDPKAAAAAHLAFDAMREKTGGGEITPERINEAEDAAAEARLEALRFDTEMRRAEALPVTNIDEGIARMEKIVKARTAKEEAERKAKEAMDMANALLGTKLLSEALETGPISGKGEARKMPEEAIKALIASFEDHPRMASAAVDVANNALDPVAVAKGVPTVGKQVDAGFKSADGKAPNGLESEKYARQLLEMGGSCGEDYFERIDDYVRLGGLMEDSPLPDREGDDLSARGQKRSVAVAGELLSDSGRLALGTDEAKLAVGNMLFHPEAMAKPTPALNKHVLETLDVLGRDPELTQANTILTGITPPTPGKAGTTLVNSALGTSTGNPSDADARQAVMASMLQSVDQGPVGSCFATAPTRQMRENDPIEAMRKYTDLAVKGTFTSASGAVIPAVTNLPPGQDPLIRSMEYTLATAMARDDTMKLRTRAESAQTKACVDLQTELANTFTGGKDSGARPLLDLLNNEFTATYDPLIPNDGKSSDDSSDRGRYVFTANDGTRITSRAEYEAKATELALQAYSETTDTENGKAIIAAIKGPFLSKLDTWNDPPWKLDTGGETANAAKTLSGLNNDARMTAENPTRSETPQEIGTRTKEVLTNLIGGFPPSPDDMVLVKTQSMHGFNALPNHPSMQEFLSGPGMTAEKIQKKLVEAGRDLAAKKLDVATAQAEFDTRMERYVKYLEDGSKDKGAKKSERSKAKKNLKKVNKLIKKHRPTAPARIDEIIDAVGFAVNPAFNYKAVENSMRNDLTAKYAEPQIVIADTNWGDSENHTFFVVAPDPRTGEPMLWQKTDPPGSMVLLDSKWIDDEWRMVT